MRKLETYGKVENGILKISYRDKFKEALKLFPDCRILLTIEKLYKHNSKEQRGYYWAVIVYLYKLGAWETQQRQITADQAHNELKLNCNFDEKYNEKTGEMARFINSSEQTTVEREEYHIRCRQFILDWFGIDVPLPNQQLKIFEP